MHVPTYRRHVSGQAVVTIPTATGRRDIYLGLFNSPKSKQEYARIIAELAVGNPRTGTDITLNEVFVAYLSHVKSYYR